VSVIKECMQAHGSSSASTWTSLRISNLQKYSLAGGTGRWIVSLAGFTRGAGRRVGAMVAFASFRLEVFRSMLRARCRLFARFPALVIEHIVVANSDVRWRVRGGGCRFYGAYQRFQGLKRTRRYRNNNGSRNLLDSRLRRVTLGWAV